MKRPPKSNPPPPSGRPPATAGRFAEFFAATFDFTPTEGAPPSVPAFPIDKDELRGPGGQKLRATIVIERKGRRGKTVTIVRGLELAPSVLEVLSKELRHRCGAGGTVAGPDIEIQGDQRSRAADYLESRGIGVTRDGG